MLLKLQKCVLGLDISTSITGATLLDLDGNILLCEAWDMRNKNHFHSLYDKAGFIEAKLNEIKLKKNIIVEEIYIEQSLHSFKSGFSSAQVLSTLSRFNGIVSWISFSTFNKCPILIAATSARKQCGIKIQKGTKAKEQVLQYILDNIPDIAIQYTKHGNPKPGSYDRADSWVIAKAGLELWKQKK